MVPDSDWHSNPQVSRQANRIADLLRIEGLDVEIAAPPAKCGLVCPTGTALPAGTTRTVPMTSSAKEGT